MKVLRAGKHKRQRRIVRSPKKIRDMQRTADIQHHGLVKVPIRNHKGHKYLGSVDLQGKGVEPGSIAGHKLVKSIKDLNVPFPPNIRKKVLAKIREIERKVKTYPSPLETYSKEAKEYQRLVGELNVLIEPFIKSKKYKKKYFWGKDMKGWQEGIFDRKKIKRILSSRVGRRNLDLAAGAQSYFPEKTTALDSNPDLLNANKSKRKILFNLNSLGKRKKRIPLRSNSFDSATILYSMSYFKYPSMVLSEAKRLLKPGGKITILGSEYLGYKEVAERQFNAGQILQDLIDLGLQVKIQILGIKGPSDYGRTLLDTAVIEATKPKKGTKLKKQSVKGLLWDALQRKLSRERRATDRRRPIIEKRRSQGSLSW